MTPRKGGHLFRRWDANTGRGFTLRWVPGTRGELQSRFAAADVRFHFSFVSADLPFFARSVGRFCFVCTVSGPGPLSPGPYARAFVDEGEKSRLRRSRDRCRRTVRHKHRARRKQRDSFWRSPFAFALLPPPPASFLWFSFFFSR